MTDEINNQENEFTEILQKIIKNNFNHLLNNIISSFGNNFFERIIKYNENFKITGLYDGLTYSLVQTITYYLFLHSPEEIKALTKDLKLKLFNLNNLDSIVEEKKEEVLSIVDEEVNKFIIDSKDYFIQQNKLYLTNDLSIEQSFDNYIYSKIKTSFYSVQQDMESDYINRLNKYLKKELIDSYSKIMNIKTTQIIILLIK